MNCPNCDREIDPNKPLAIRHPDYVHSSPNPGHGEDCMLRAFLVAVLDREEHDLAGIRLEPIDITAFWDKVNPVTDWLEGELGLATPPETVTITRAAQGAQCDNCGRAWSLGALEEVDDLDQRIDPGGIVPSGQCPDCGALCYPATPGENSGT